MTEGMWYEALPEITPHDAVTVFRAGKPEAIAKALLGLSFYGQDPDFTLPWCLFFLSHRDEDVALAAVTSIGHLARVFGRINKAVAIPALEIARSDHRIAGTIDSALADIAIFCSET